MSIRRSSGGPDDDDLGGGGVGNGAARGRRRRQHPRLRRLLPPFVGDGSGASSLRTPFAPSVVATSAAVLLVSLVAFALLVSSSSDSDPYSPSSSYYYKPLKLLRGGYGLGGRPSMTTPDDALIRKKLLFPVQSQVVHRHGDRTPITPMADVPYWSSLLPSDSTLRRIGSMTDVVREEGSSLSPHPAGGGDVFGRLTVDGIDQMVELGRTFRGDVADMLARHRSELSSSKRRSRGGGGGGRPEEEGDWDLADPTPWLRVASTDFSRTVQSVQGVLSGLLRDGLGADNDGGDDEEDAIVVVRVDARHTSKMIPDPQPRRFVGQAELERELMSRPEFVDVEARMRPLAVRVTDALRRSGLLGDDAARVSFGVGEDETANGGAGKREVPADLGGDRGGGGTNASEPGPPPPPPPLPWNQLAEILKCLETRNRLPPGIGIRGNDLEAVADHNAWRWFALLGDERLGPMAIKSMAKKMVLNAAEAVESWEEAEKEGERGRSEGGAKAAPSPLLHIFSGHDATLIALMCAFRLERPPVWPEYGSYLKMDLLRDDDGVLGSGDAVRDRHNDDGKRPKRRRYYVIFSLNGAPLRSRFGKTAGAGPAAENNGQKTELRYFVPWEDLLVGMENLERGLPPLADGKS